MHPLMKIQGLRKEFHTGGLLRGQQIRALDGVDLEIYPGETLGLVGESACGKTTLARCALMLLDPTSGSIHFDGTDLRSISASALRKKRREFQMIFQDPLAALDPLRTVAKILSEPFEAQGLGTPRQRSRWAIDLLETVGLDVILKDRRPASLSGGQQQRVGIARALALKPRLLVADEPVSALDPSVQAEILNLLASLQERMHLTLILISHSLPVVYYLCTRVVVMYLGRIVEDAPAEVFFRAPKHPYSQALLKSMPSLDAKPRLTGEVFAGEVPSPVHPPSGCYFHPRCPQVMPQCKKDYPALASCAESEKVACFLYGKDAVQT